jgi:hypothetical protein
VAEPRPVDFERRQHECERAMLCRVVRLEGREWVVASVDHLARVGDLRGIVPTAFGPSQSADYSIRNVPIDELAGLAGCSCGLHGWQDLPPSAAPAPAAPVSALAWVACALQPPPDDGSRIFWWRPGPYPRRLGKYYDGRFFDDLVAGEDCTGVGAEQVTHWAPMPENEPELRQLSLDEVARG